MGELSEAKLGIVRRLIEQAPDSAVRNLLRALAADGPHDASLTLVQQLLEAEFDRPQRTQRRARADRTAVRPFWTDQRTEVSQPHARADLEGAETGGAGSGRGGQGLRGEPAHRRYRA